MGSRNGSSKWFVVLRTTVSCKEINKDKEKGNDNKFHEPVAAFVFMSHIGLPTLFFAGLR